MRRSHAFVHRVTAAVTGLTLATIGSAAIAGTGANDSRIPSGPASVASHRAAASQVGTRSATQTSAQGSSLTLLVKAPHARIVRLVRLPGQGWTLQPTRTPDGGARPTGAAEATLVAATAPALDSNASMREPLAVFIDGPTGFTFIWARDQGWRFLGRVADMQD